MLTAPSEASQRTHVAERVQTRLPSVPASRVRRLVVDEWRAFDDAAVKTFVPVLVERRVLHRLRTSR